MKGVLLRVKDEKCKQRFGRKMKMKETIRNTYIYIYIYINGRNPLTDRRIEGCKLD
jgi:hypothetical protein